MLPGCRPSTAAAAHPSPLPRPSPASPNARSWKRNDDFPECHGCGGANTREHAFTQTWCAGRRKWEAESLCLDCHSFTHRTYADPDFMLPEEMDKAAWTA